MIEKLINYFKLNIKYALKNVFSNFKGNICMLLIIFILQAMVSVILLTYHDNSEKNTADTIENYDWHIVLLKCTKDQASYIIHPDIQYRYTFKLYPLKYEVVRTQIVEVSNELNEERYDVYIKLHGESLIQAYNNFRQQFNMWALNVALSPLYYFEAKYTLSDLHYFIMEEVNFTYLSIKQKTDHPYVSNFVHTSVPFFIKPFLGINSDNIDIDTGVLLVSLIIWAVFSSIILSQTLRTKVNLAKYMHGILKVVGADVKKQRTILRWELICMEVITLLPSYLTGCLIFRQIVLSQLIPTIVYSLILILIASRKPINIIIKESCVNLIKASDTTDYVTSPRMSWDLLKFKKYPLIQALLSIWRMRKYFISLIFSVTILLSLFICSMSLADSYEKNLTTERPQWRIAFEYNDYNPVNVIPPIEKINGVTRVEINDDLELDIYGDSDYDTAGRKIREWMHKSNYIATFTDFHADHMTHILKMSGYDKTFRIIGVMILTMIPVICIYTQSSYYHKRRNESKVYNTIGVVNADIRKYTIVDGIFLGIIAVPFSLLTTVVCYQLILLCMNFLDTYFKLSVVNMRSFTSGSIALLILLMVSPIISNKPKLIIRDTVNLIRQFVGRIITYYKFNIKYAVLNIFSNLKGNVCMILIVFILQSMLTVILLTAQDNSLKNTADTLENYDWHIMLPTRTRNEAAFFTSPGVQEVYSRNVYPTAYEVVRVQMVEVSNELNEECYDVYIKLYGNSIIQSYANFRQNLYYDDDPVVFSPLYYFDAKYTLSDFWYYIMEDVSYFIISITDEKPGPPEVTNCFGNPVPFFVKPFLGIDADKMKIEIGVMIISLAIWAAFSTSILSQTLRTKINLDKYMYGIFKMVGADVKKQRTLIRWELICISVTTFIPAYLIGCLIYFKFMLLPVLATAVISFILILIASRRPINIIVRESCVNLIKSGDTSDYVSSPRKSCNILKFNYPFIQALLAIWRLRKYFLSLIFSVTILLSLFICSMSLADSYAKNLTTERPQWKLAFEYNDYNPVNVIPPIEKINGVTRVEINDDNELEIYGEGDIETAGRKIREWMYKSGYSAAFTDFRTESMMHILRTTAYDKCFRIIGVMTLLMIPVICTYTQSSYYFKKRNEFKVFRTVGIETDEVKKFLRADGIFLGMFAIPFSVLTTWICYQLILLGMDFLDTYFKLSVVNILSFAIGNAAMLIILMVSPIISRRVSKI